MRTLADTIKISMTDFQNEKVARIDAEDFSGVRRKTAEELSKQGTNVSKDYLDRGILALKQYYAIAMLDPVNMHAIPDVVDPFWHMHILHTRKYMIFCEEVIGAYMHHDPLDHSDLDKVKGVKRLYDYTIDVYQQIFGYIDREFYPEGLPLQRMICPHFGQTLPQLQKDSVFPPVRALDDVHQMYGASS